jgi:hypothetical protein
MLGTGGVPRVAKRSLPASIKPRARPWGFGALEAICRLTSRRRSTSNSRGFIDSPQHAHMEAAASNVDHAPMKEDAAPASIVEVAGILSDLSRLIRSRDRLERQRESRERRRPVRCSGTAIPPRNQLPWPRRPPCP